jgi:hypothetical protein
MAPCSDITSNRATQMTASELEQLCRIDPGLPGQQLQSMVEIHLGWHGDREPQNVAMIAEIVVGHGRMRTDDIRDVLEVFLWNLTRDQSAFIAKSASLQYRGNFV